MGKDVDGVFQADRVHYGVHTLNRLHACDVFAEMTLLDPQPRVASVTTVRDTGLLQLDEASLFILLDERIAIARGIIKPLVQQGLGRVNDLDAARGSLPVPSEAAQAAYRRPVHA